VIGLSMLLLAMVFRSIAVPIKAALMNLLSVAATYGVLVAVFQWGWGASLLGISKTGPIDSALPMMLFAILFGLSMDYEVFLLSRVREEYPRTRNNGEAVAHGLAVTARVIAAAAAIMVVVFGSFIFSGSRINAEFGLGLAVAIFVDATVVRLVLVPATMELLGDGTGGSRIGWTGSCPGSMSKEPASSNRPPWPPAKVHTLRSGGAVPGPPHLTGRLTG
jgi:RND superfamily putative drug exporter